ncbi:hypothetical protein BJB45_05150 [Halomonas huangheensis]|uniref:Uncharacterized protein n=1 Tax=Halomonas huangheensis TaxID=1178482 RepID=W1N5R0_9GAMM|nr:hypothetical protein BJB45_05150 [Halomonas huangheensis]
MAEAGLHQDNEAEPVMFVHWLGQHGIQGQYKLEDL